MKYPTDQGQITGFNPVFVVVRWLERLVLEMTYIVSSAWYPSSREFADYQAEAEEVCRLRVWDVKL